ncbi:MAG: FadR/GntR family transcriptional regulator [Chloroflexota bacterium]|nr:FadR/GntR family transcriptional regulator [Chloroflexota bacterium]
MEPIQTPSIPEAIVQRIIRMIGGGTWKPGDCLPPQRQLARELDVGMSSLREALQTLQGMGVLCLRQGQGTFVCHNPSQIVERCLNLALVLDRDMVEDFLDARRVVEGGLAYLAAKRATGDQIAQLVDLVRGMKEAVDSGDDARFEELDVPYHRLIAEMSSSNILQYLGSTLFETLEEFIRVVPHTPQGWQRHADVCAAIEARDPDRSEKAMRDLVDATAAYIHFLQSNGG